MERRRLGRTGHESSVAVLGGAACWAATVDEAGQWLQLALDHGVNHLDIAPQYGAAESVVGPHLAAHREELFIVGNTLRANPDGVTDQFDTTRRLLNADVLDLYQAHAVTSLEELDRRSAASSGFWRCVTPATPGSPGSPGTTWRCRGVSPGTPPFRPRHRHVPGLSALWSRPEYRVPAEELLALCAERDVGVMAIKAAARRPWADGRPLADAIAGATPPLLVGPTRGTSRRPATTSSTAGSTSPSGHRACRPSARPGTLRCCPECWQRPSVTC